ncbi:MAG: tRNA lysidine(34) synthetase TilS [Chlamydiae bacterium]|nr:tRNA lysidine(34) synthetase TilS [Chlamydiota bacterium]
MKDLLFQKVRDFLQQRLISTGPVLVGFSGGPDSLALVLALIECKRLFPLEIHLAHVDHGWRAESGKEAEGLKILAENFGLPFHLKTLSEKDFAVGNKENIARNLRHSFFQEIYEEIKPQALLLAHQMDDLAETVLKRIFEGGGIFSWGSMQPVSKFCEMSVWRPLLTISKKNLLEWLHERGATYYIVDSTNLDSAYLRGRMRKEIFPYLEELFGKNIVSSLCALSEEAESVTAPLLADFSEYASHSKRGLLGVYLDFRDLEGLPKLQYPLFLKFFLAREGVSLSRAVVRSIASALEKEDLSQSYLAGNQTVHVERHRLFLMKDLPVLSSSISLKEGRGNIGEWNYELTLIDSSKSRKPSTWIDAFDGHIYVDLPEGEYVLAPYLSLKGSPVKDFLLKKMSSSGVPTFLRSLFPFVLHNDELIHEFLTGENRKKCPTNISKRLSLRIFLDRK